MAKKGMCLHKMPMRLNEGVKKKLVMAKSWSLTPGANQSCDAGRVAAFSSIVKGYVRLTWEVELRLCSFRWVSLGLE